MSPKSIGADQKNDIVFLGRHIASQHAIFSEEDGRFFIEDLSSTFGTFVNGQRINKKIELKVGDRVKVGTQLFHWGDFIENSVERNPIHFIDLLNPKGVIDWQDFKIVILLFLGLTLVIPLAVPAMLLLLNTFLSRKFRHSDAEIDLTQLTEVLFWVVSILVVYIFLNLTQKAIRGSFKLN